uniref:Protein tincar n=1 Tax=Lepeophtheirus salmonis TaxID=72036 RepID=A0A0K2T0T5_LEPSM
MPGPSGSEGPRSVPGRATSVRKRCCDVHCNSLWSVWYGILVVIFQSFILYKCVTRFLIYVALPWPEKEQPYLELNLYVGLVGAGVVLLPFYFISFMFKIGNLANDGYKLGMELSSCAMDPPSILSRSNGVIRNVWHHGGPTSAFIHLVSAFCFVLPKIFIEGKLIHVGFLAKDKIWKTDLDWLVPYQDRLVILNFLTGGLVNASFTTTTQAPYLHPAAQIREYLESEDSWWPMCPEFLNYILALTVYGVRYSSVFWNTNKIFAFVFSLQLFANSIQSLISIGGIAIMYKIQILGPQNVLHKYEPFLLNGPICILLYVLGCVILTTSSSVLYMYGYQKFNAFVESEREKRHIFVREGKSSLWSYFPHCSAMCILIALVVCNGPLLYDYTLIYKGSLDGTVLYTVITIISHLFLWIVTWLFLTVKQNWTFKLRVTVGRSVVKSARSIKLVNDIDLDSDAENGPMLIVGYGKTFTVNESEPKKLIMNTLARAAIEKEQNLENEGEGSSVAVFQTLQRKKSVQNNNNGSSSSNSSPAKQKVTFDHPNFSPTTLTKNNRRQTEMDVDGVDAEIQTDLVNPGHDSSLSPLLIPQDEPNGSDDIELPPPPGHHSLGEEAAARLMVSPRPAPRKTQAAVHNNDDVHTPRSNRSVDSGLPHDDVTPRSDSLSTASSSVSPPDQSISSSVIPDHRKSTSLDDINIQQQIQEQQQGQWKTYSLQRGGSGAPPHQKEEVVNIRPGMAATQDEDDEEDPYGRCMNMKLSTFEASNTSANNLNNNSRDPRIIDLGYMQQQQRPGSSAFNTLPVNNNLNNLNSSNGRGGKPPLSSGPNNTLPARPVSTCNSIRNGPTGRHFKPFDHRKMNPMAGIQENAVYGTIPPQNNSPPPPVLVPTEVTLQRNNLIVQKTNNTLPHMPAELRHTNYASPSNAKQLVNPQILSHRDSANFSLASNEST